ncbi:hypothetical protein PCK1_001544 [Pneumocystis canis]|nr:hypothetical protein PCK1_001544 [Pneumocystis canis]
MTLLFFLFSFWFIYKYQCKYEKKSLITTVAALSIGHTLSTLCLYPVDLVLVSSKSFFSQSLLIKPWKDLTIDRLRLLYYLFYGLHIINLFIVLPFTYYFYDEWNEKSTIKTRIFGALRRSLFFLLFATLFITGFFITIVQTNSNLKIDFSQQTLIENRIKKIMLFIVGVLLLIGSKNIPTSTSDMKHALILNREKQRTIEVCYIALQSLQREERALLRRVRLAEERKNKWLETICSMLRIFQLFVGSLFFLTSIAIVLSMTITLVGKLKNAYSRTFYNYINTTWVSSWFSLLSSFLSRETTFLIFYLCATSIMGIFNMKTHVNFNFFKFNSYKKKGSLLHTLLISIAILILTSFSFNYTLSEIIIPNYSHFGNQTYCNYTISNSQGIYDCVNHSEYIYSCSKTNDYTATRFCILSILSTIIDGITSNYKFFDSCKLYVIQYIFKKYNYINQKLFSSFSELNSKKNTESTAEYKDDIIDIKKLNISIDNAIHYLKKESESLKMGRSNPSLLHNLRIPISKGKSALLKELAHVSMKNSKSMVLTIYDNDNVKFLISAIQSSSFGFNPIVNPSNSLQYTIPLPPSTEESRKKSLLQVLKLKENIEMNIRNIRTMNMKRLRKAKQQNELSEDEVKFKEKEITRIFNQVNQEIEKIIQDTKKSILES